jgi:ketosteroid isomerase-like protein
MSMSSAARLARGWIQAWNDLDMAWLRRTLAPDFVHTSPFGRLEGRNAYLATVEPLARKSVRDLTIRDIVARGDRACIWFENRTPAGMIPSCDWVRVEDGRIVEVRSFYDSARVRAVLSAGEQDSLDGARREPPDASLPDRSTT